MVGRRGGALLLSLCVVALALAPACVDLFHSTDFETRCALDAAAPGCPAEASTSTDFCVWSSATARLRAEHACAWLGACSAPFDRNAFGPCMIDAILAYDCKTNPNRPVRGALHEFWDALWQAQSCDAVARALVPQGEACGSVGYGCGGGDAGDILFECATKRGVASPESCLVQGRTCEKSACVPPGASTECRAPSCSGSVLHDCEEGRDVGYDCRYFGAGACTGEEDAAACSPADAGARCTPTTRVTCGGGGLATACATGHLETVDCKALAGDDSCHSGIPTPSWNLAEACQGTGSCTPGCEGDTLIGCDQGAEYKTSCSEQKLGRCKSLPIVGTGGNPAGYACGEPGE
jgi:hypothetical protein